MEPTVIIADMQVIVDGLLSSYYRLGKGKRILILHGWGDNSKSWKPFADRLVKDYEIIVPDLPGFGASEAPRTAWGLDDYAAFVAAFLVKIGATADIIIGHSNGGAIALRGLASGKLSASRLILLASAGIRGEYEGRNKTIRLVTKTGKQFSRILPKATQSKLRSKVYQAIGSDMLVAEKLQETFKKVVTDDVRADASKISIPTLLVYGEDDSATPVNYGEKLHKLIRGSKLEILPGAGHFLFLENEASIIKSIRDFLK